MLKEEQNAKCIESQKSELGNLLFKIFSAIYSSNFQMIYSSDSEEITPQTTNLVEIVDMHKKLIDKIQGNSDGQTFAFESESGDSFECIRKLLWQEIVLLRDLNFLNGSLNRVGPNTERILFYDQFLPFNNEPHNDEDCVPVKDLPPFYKNKGTK